MKMFKKLKNKIESKRQSKNKFWKSLVFAKDLVWALSVLSKNFIKKCLRTETIEEFSYRERDKLEVEKEWKEYSTKEKKEKHDISVIICVYKRKKYLKEQLDAILNQSVKPAEIFVLQNESHINISKYKKKYKNIKFIHSGENTLYLRWVISYICKGDYIAVFDDDCIPGRKWLENCLRACKEHNSLVGASGRRFDPLGVWRKRQPNLLSKEGKFDFFGLLGKKHPTQKSSYFSSVGVRKGIGIVSDKEDIEVDWVCNSYFFKKEWLPYIVKDRRYMNLQKYIDDIQLAVSLKKKGIKTFVPKQISEKSPYSGNIKIDYGGDFFALWKNSSKFFLYREHYLDKLDKEGFNFYKNKEKAYVDAYRGPRFIIIVSFHTKEFLEKCLFSLENQKYKNWKCVLIDDASLGEFSLRLKKLLKNPKYHLIVNKRKLYALKSREIATESAGASEEDVIVHLDGDDWFDNNWALFNLAYAYKDKNVWVTYGSCKKLEEGRLVDLPMYALGNIKIKNKWGNSKKQTEFPEEIVRKRDFRKYLWSALHPRTFKYKLWKAIDKKDFLDENGEYFKCATDMAMMMPILEMAGKRIKFIQNILYIYNRDYPGNIAKIYSREHSAHNYIRSKKKYPLYEEVVKNKK